VSVRRTLRAERGEFSLTGLLVAMTLFIIVLGATLLIFETGLRVQRDTTDRADAQEQARTTIDTLTRQLRNLASPTPDQPLALDRKGPTDLIFQTVDPVKQGANQNVANVKRVRYCLSGTKLYRQELRYIVAKLPEAPGDTACPGAGWENAKDYVVADHVNNNARNLGRPVFIYNAATAADVTSIRVDLFIDLQDQKGPQETQIASGVFLRNQNRKPIPSFTGTKTAGGIVLNGSTSVDPEGDPLIYCWYDAVAPDVANPPMPCPRGKTSLFGNVGGYVGAGVVYTYGAATLPRNITLITLDPANLQASLTKSVP
jgi:type II secretory pathway component PulJ